MTKNWRTKDIYKLIHLYRRSECLWDARSDGYSRSDVKQEAWKRIAMECNSDVLEVKKKIKNLRSTYVYEKRKVDKSRQKAATPDDVYEPHLYYYNEFQFLENICISRKVPGDEQDSSNAYFTYSLKDETEGEPTDPFNHYAQQHQEEEDEDNDSQLSAADGMLSPELLTPSSDANSYKEEPHSNSPKRVKKLRKTDNNNKNDRIDNALETIAAAVRCETTETVYTLFAKTIALQLQQLPAVEAIETMSEIHNLTSKKLLKSMRATQDDKFTLSN